MRKHCSIQHPNRGWKRRVWGVSLLVLLATQFPHVGNANTADSAKQQEHLVRLSYWVPPERHAEFELVFDREIAPLLARHGLDQSVSTLGERATPDSVFSRLFALETGDAWYAIHTALWGDSELGSLHRRLGEEFGTTKPDGVIRNMFAPYRSLTTGDTVPAGPGRKKPAGPGSGLWRSFDVTELAASRTTSLAHVPDGNLWIGGYGGLTRYDGHSFRAYTKANGLAGDLVYTQIVDRSGALWIATLDGGVSRFDGEQFENFGVEDGIGGRIRHILEDRAGALWFTTNEGLHRYDGTAFRTYTTRDGLATNKVEQLLEDKAGNLWVTSLCCGASRFDGESFQTFTTSDGLPDNWVTGMYEDRDGGLWFKMGDGLSRYDGSTFRTFTTQDGLPGNKTDGMLHDHRGTLWVGTNRGLARFEGERFTAVAELSGPMWGRIEEDDAGNVWFGTKTDGVARYDGRRFTTFSNEDGLAGARFKYHDPDGSLWFAHKGALTQYNGDLTNFTTWDGLPHDSVRDVVCDREGSIWLATLGGACRYDGEYFVTYGVDDGMTAGGVDGVNSIVQDREGAVWFSGGGGISRYDGRHFTNFTREHGLIVVRGIERLMLDQDDRVWAALRYWSLGASRYSDGRLETFTHQDGLRGNSVQFMQQARNGAIWFGSGWDGVVSRFDGRSFEEVKLVFRRRNNCTKYI